MFQPDWRLMDFMNIITVQGSSFIIDAVNTTRAMTSDALTTQEISGLFDSVAYDKCKLQELFKMLRLTEIFIMQLEVSCGCLNMLSESRSTSKL